MKIVSIVLICLSVLGCQIPQPEVTSSPDEVTSSPNKKYLDCDVWQKKVREKNVSQAGVCYDKNGELTNRILFILS